MGVSQRHIVKLRVALVSYDERELRVRKNYLEEQNPALSCICFSRGKTLLQELRQGRSIDVVVLSNQLEDMDGYEFINRLNSLRSRPLLLLQGDGWYGEATATCLRSNGESYLLERSRLRDLLQDLRTSSEDLGSLWVVPFCNELYAKWGIPQPDGNSEYLTSALQVACETDRKLALRKEILQAVAEEHHVTVAAVDSGLRRVIEGLESRNTESWQEFKRKNGLAGGKITTGKLVGAMRKILLEGRPRKAQTSK